MNGNQFMVLPELVALWEQQRPDLSPLFYETLPPGLLVEQVVTGALGIGTLTLQLMPDVITAGPDMLAAGQEHHPQLEAGGYQAEPRGVEEPMSVTRMGSLLLLRHGQSLTNAEGRFTGWLDVDLTELGRREGAAAAGSLVAAGLFPDVVHTSRLRRAVGTAKLVVTQMARSAPPVYVHRSLDERHYGALTGCVKSEVLAEVGERQYALWRNSLRVAPPPLTAAGLSLLRAGGWPVEPLAGGSVLTESLGDVAERVMRYWADVLAPQIAAGAVVLVVAHGNSLRALMTGLDRLSQDELGSLRLPTGVPRMYGFGADLVPLHRGGRVLPTGIG